MLLLRAVATMCSTTIITSFVCVTICSIKTVGAVVNPGPSHPPTKGEVWPEPQQQTFYSAYYSFDPAQFTVRIINQNCTLLTQAKQRYIYIFKVLPELSKKYFVGENTLRQHDDGEHHGLIKELQIDLTEPCEDYPHFEMDESYNLTVSSQAQLQSASIWGILRGMETFSQLFYLTDDFTDVRINKTEIIDFPRYPHRGLLLDTSRHFISMRNILRTLDAMAINKMNVFHWHIVDDQSFPYQSHKFPELSAKGAYNPSMVYTKDNIDAVVQYARGRGIRVIPEFDVPGHTRSWGEAYPNILTKCYNSHGKVIGLGPMDPTKNTTYKLMRDLFQEVQERFPDKYFHIGGDEVELSCWESNPQIQEYMMSNNISEVTELHAIFMRNTTPLLAATSQPIVWQEVFDEGVPLSEETLVQVWKTYPVPELVNILTAGHKALFSSAYYLDHLDKTFKNMYIVDAREWVMDATGNESLALNILGGEACMWGEMIDDRNFMSRVWPRASAVAERLWSASRDTWRRLRDNGIPERTLSRVEEQTCRMIRRGVPAEPPSGPGYCLA